METKLKNIVTAAATIAVNSYKLHRDVLAKAGHEHTKKVVAGETYTVNNKVYVAGVTYHQRMKVGFALAWAAEKARKATYLVKATTVQPAILQLTHRAVRLGTESKKYWAVELTNLTTLNLSESKFVGYHETESTSCKHSYVHKFAEIHNGKVYLINRNGQRDYVINRTGEVEYVGLAEALAYATTLVPVLAAVPVVEEISEERAEKLADVLSFTKPVTEAEKQFVLIARGVHSSVYENNEITKQELFIIANSAAIKHDCVYNEEDGSITNFKLYTYSYKKKLAYLAINAGDSTMYVPDSDLLAEENKTWFKI